MNADLIQVRDEICALLRIPQEYYPNIKYDADGPYWCSDSNVVAITECMHWNGVYQISHELLHLAFYIYNNGVTPEVSNWIEEVVCEAFSIYCLTRFASHQSRHWVAYLTKNLYINHNYTKAVPQVESIEQLNDALIGYKTYEIRQFVHPWALEIFHIIQWDFSELTRCLKYTQYVDRNKISGTSCENKIIQCLVRLQNFILNV